MHFSKYALSLQRKWDKPPWTKTGHAMLCTTTWGPSCSVSCTAGLPRGFCTLSNLPKHATQSKWVLGSSYGILCMHTPIQTRSLCFCPSDEATYWRAFFSESPLDSTSHGSSLWSFIPHWPWQYCYADIVIFIVYSPLFHFLVVIIFCRQEMSKYIQCFITSRL